MNISANVQHKADELLATLDLDIEHIHRCLSELDELRAMVIRRDEKGLNVLLEGIRAGAAVYASNEQRRQSLRSEIAGFLGLEEKQLTLSCLGDFLSGERKAAVIEKRRQLLGLVEQLRKEHISAAVLLNDCARINALLLRGILEQTGSSLVCYDANGATKRADRTAFVNVRL